MGDMGTCLARALWWWQHRAAQGVGEGAVWWWFGFAWVACGDAVPGPENQLCKSCCTMVSEGLT